MKRIIAILSIIITILSGCEQKETPPSNTVFFFFPWSTNLTHYFENNIKSFEYHLTKKEFQQNRVIVFISQSAKSACMYEIKMKQGKCIHDTIAKFENYKYEYTKTEGLSHILNLAKGNTPTPSFSMIIGCHGDAWIPAKDMKRSFGGGDIESRIDISTLHDALKQSNLKSEYILFDDCYMASIEVAYELREVCNFLIASPAEIMAQGMPFKDIAIDLLNTPNYENICNDFYNYYANNYSAPYGAISITNCKELDKLASIVKRINQSATNDTQNLNIQTYDSYDPHIFYDLGHYISNYCVDQSLIEEFNTQINNCIPYKAHTKYVYAYNFGQIEIKYYSGISTSAPSTNSKCASYTNTQWYKATH